MGCAVRFSHYIVHCLGHASLKWSGQVSAIPNTVGSEFKVKFTISRIKRFIFSLDLLFSSQINFTMHVKNT